MSTTTITISASTNPTYGGYIRQDASGGPDYVRGTLDSVNPTASFDGGNLTQRIFAFFDLSTDPTSGGTITKVELLGTVNSVGGTHAVNVYGCDGTNEGVEVGTSDEGLYGADVVSNSYISSVATAAGAIVVDLGSQAITDVNHCIANGNTAFVGMQLSNEAAAGSVVFDAATGFGLRITFTQSGLGNKSIMLTRAG